MRLPFKITSALILLAAVLCPFAGESQTVSTNAPNAAAALESATTIVGVSTATAPISGQVLTATSSTNANWQTPSGGGAVSSVANADGTLIISPTTGTVVSSLNLNNPNTWTATQTYGTGLLSATAPSFSGTIAGTYTEGAGATWNGVAVGAQWGGTGHNFSASTGVQVWTAGTASVTTTPTLTGTNITGMPASGLTGTLAAGQFPALTGGVTTTAGSLATTVTQLASNTLTNGD